MEKGFLAGFRQKVTNLFSPATEIGSKNLITNIASSGDIRVLAKAELNEEGKPLTQKEKSNIPRIKYEDLELVYLSNPTFTNGINKISQTIMAAGWELKCSNARIKSYYLRFLENIGHVGNDMTWDELLARIFRDQCIYGSAWVEDIYNKTNKRIVDLDIIDPKKMDYAKTSMEDISLDDYGRPIGFTQKIPWQMAEKVKGDEWPKGVSKDTERIFLEPRRIAHFKLAMVGDGFYPLGLIEPAYNQAIWKMNIEKGLANSVHMSGFPTRVAYVGDPNHEPTPEQINSVVDKLQGINYKQNLGVPYNIKIELLEAKHPEKMQENLSYFREQEITSMGVPKPFATGGGEETNRATLTNQERMFRLTLKDIARRTASVIKKQIFERIAELEGFKVVPDLVFGEIEQTAEMDRGELLLKAVQAGILRPEEVKDEFLKIKKF